VTRRNGHLATRHAGSAGAGAGNGQRAAGAPRPTIGTLWTLDSAGQVKSVRVRTGLTDGQKTEVQSQNLAEGTQVIVGVGGEAATPATTAATSNPFQPQRGPGGGARFLRSHGHDATHSRSS
jgi:hypothetical protein